MDFNRVKIEKLGKQLLEFEKKWIAVSSMNKIVASGESYDLTAKKAKQEGFTDIVLLKVPPIGSSLSPNS